MFGFKSVGDFLICINWLEVIYAYSSVVISFKTNVKIIISCYFWSSFGNVITLKYVVREKIRIFSIILHYFGRFRHQDRDNK